MQDLIEAYLSVYDDIEEAKLPPLFDGAPPRAHKFPLTPTEKKSAAAIGKAAEDMANKRSSESTTRSGRRIPGPTPTNTSVSSRRKSKGTTSKSGDTWTATPQHENFYDLVLGHLLDEGYCDSEENAIQMMAAMSEDWIDSIING